MGSQHPMLHVSDQRENNPKAHAMAIAAIHWVRCTMCFSIGRTQTTTAAVTIELEQTVFSPIMPREQEET